MSTVRCSGRRVATRKAAGQTGQSSPAGHRYDLLSDCFSNIIAFIGLGIGQAKAVGWAGPLLGAVAGAGIGTLFAQLHLLRIGNLRGYRPAPGILIDPDDLLVFVPVLVWGGATVPMLVAAAVITPLAAVWLAVSGARRRAPATE